MSVCQYWLQGTCKFGNGCWNRHSLDNAAPVARNNANAKKAVADWRTLSDEDIIKGISSEISTWETSKMWPLSVFSFANGAPILPGLNNYSFEELRSEAYSALANKSFDQHVSKLTELLTEARQQKAMLKNPDMSFRAKLLEFIHRAKTGNSGTFFSPTPNVPSTATTNVSSVTQFSNFSNQQQTMTTQMNPAGGFSLSTSAFPSQQPVTFPSISNAVASTASVHASVQPVGGPIFPAVSHAVLPGTEQSSSQFVTHIASIPTTVAPTETKTRVLFGKEVSAADVALSSRASNYTPMQELSPEEVKAYTADHFDRLENIPVKPPPKELC